MDLGVEGVLGDGLDELLEEQVEGITIGFNFIVGCFINFDTDLLELERDF